MQTTKGDEAGGGATIDPSHPQLSFVVHPLQSPPPMDPRPKHQNELAAPFRFALLRPPPAARSHLLEVYTSVGTALE